MPFGCVVSTCQLSVLGFPDFWRETFHQGCKTRKGTPNLGESWFFEGFRTGGQRDSRSSRLVRHEVCSDSPYDLVEPPESVCHLAWSVGSLESQCGTWEMVEDPKSGGGRIVATVVGVTVDL